MIEEVEKYQIPLFDGTNFSNWKFRMETLLNEMDLMGYVEKPYIEMVDIPESKNATEQRRRAKQIEDFSKCDRKCKSQIIQRIADSHLEYAKDKQTAFDLWTLLCETFERKGIASQLLIRKSLLSMKFDSKNDTLANYFLKFDKLVRNLRSTGTKLEELDVVCHLLLTMPSKYNNVVTAVETLANDNLTIGFVKDRLKDEESKRNDVKKVNANELFSSTAFSSQSRQKVKGGQMNSTSKFPFKCNYCEKVGHKLADCRKRKYDLKNKNKTTQSANTAGSEESNSKSDSFCFSVTTRNNVSNEVKWYLDSGATEHLINGDIPLCNVEKLQVPIKIKIAKTGTYLLAKRSGEIQLLSLIDGNEVTITIKNALSVPQLTYNLLSVSKLEMNGFRITFENGQGLITKGNKRIAVAHRNNLELYELTFRKPVLANLSTNDGLDIWHKRMGHLNYEDVKKLTDKTTGLKVNFPRNVKRLCEICIEGKQTHKSHNQQRKRATRPLQLVHSDFIGPISPISRKNKRYVLTFIDDFTHFTASYNLESKTEVLR